MPLGSTPSAAVDLSLAVRAVQARHRSGSTRSAISVLQSAGMSKSAVKALPMVELSEAAINALATARHQTFEHALYSLLSPELAEAVRPRTDHELVAQADEQRRATRVAHEQAMVDQALTLQAARERHR